MTSEKRNLILFEDRLEINEDSVKADLVKNVHDFEKRKTLACNFLNYPDFCQ